MSEPYWEPLNALITSNPYVPACRAYYNGSYSVPNSAWTAIPLNSESYDTDGMHDNTTNNSRLTVRTAGKYLFVATGEFVGSAGGVHRLYAIRKNGGPLVAQGGLGGVTIGATGFPRGQAVAVCDMAVNDFVEMNAYQDSGAALGMNSEDAEGGATLTATWLGPGVTVGALSPPTYGLSLPASPTDGQEVYLVDSLTLPGFCWHMRYVAAITDAYKWVCLGGHPLIASYAGTDTMALTGTATNIPNGPLLTVPFTGGWDISTNLLMTGTPASAHLTYVDWSGILGTTSGGDASPGNTKSWYLPMLLDALLTTGTVLRPRASSPQNVTMSFASRYIRIIPRRLS